MSVITSGTPNNLRYIKTHKTHNTDRHLTLSVRTLRVRELCRHDRDNLQSITNSGTWMLILAPTYSTKIFIGQTAYQHTLFPLSSVCYLPEIRSSVSSYLVQSRYRQVSLLVSVILHPATNLLVTL